MSYTSADRPWAEWIAWELEQAGHSTIIQAWDMQPGSNFVLEIDNARRAAERTIAVLTPAFLASPVCRAEWASALQRDPTGADRRLVPVRVRECQPDGLLGSVIYLDVVGLSEAVSRDKLLAGLSGARAKPVAAPVFPGTDPRSEVGERVRRGQDGTAILSVPVMIACSSDAALSPRTIDARLRNRWAPDEPVLAVDSGREVGEHALTLVESSKRLIVV